MTRQLPQPEALGQKIVNDRSSEVMQSDFGLPD
jgi:hypothetical protein